MATINIHDGAMGIGGTKLEIRDGESRIMIDFGASFTGEQLYFETYPTRGGYKERLASMRGLRLLPTLDERDFSTELYSTPAAYGACPASTISAIFLSHAHADHYGCIPYLSPKIPLYATPQTLALYRQAMIKSSKDNFVNDYANNEAFRPIPTPNLGDYGVCVKGMEIIPLTSSEQVCEQGIKIRPVRVDHSLPGACAFFITTSNGTKLLYTGDFRAHGTLESSPLTKTFLEEAVKFSPQVLIPEGTRIAEYSNETEEGDPESGVGSLKSFLEAEMKLAFAREAMVLIGVSGKNVDRIDTVYEVTERLGATLHISVYNASLFQLLAKAGGFDDSHIVSRFAADPRFHLYERYVGELAKSSTLASDAFAKRRHLIGDYGDPAQGLQKNVVFLLFDGDLERLESIKPRRGSKYIHSATEPFDEDMQADRDRLLAWLAHFGVTYHQLHTSGHIHGAQLKEAIRKIDPKYILPLHTQHYGHFLDVLGDERRCLDGRPSSDGAAKVIDLQALFPK
jgi:ribonuclease J